jgi:CheY-like chemotaxis protein
MLRALGVGQVVEVVTAEAALAALADTGIDCAIIDHGLPDGGGLGLAARIRRGRVRPDLPIMLVLGIASDGAARAAADAGVNGVLGRPLAAEALAGALAAALGRGRPFIVSARYVGPCRRQARAAREGKDRRRWAKAHPAARR